MNRNILILKFPAGSLFGGGEVHTINLVEGLRKQGFHFYLVSSCPVLLNEFKKRKWPVQKFWAGTEPVSKLGILLFTFLAPIIFWKLFVLLIKYRIKEKVDVLYCLTLTEKLLLTLPARLFGIKVLWIEHLRIENWLLKNPYRIFYTLYSRFAKLIPCSRAVARQLGSLGVPEKNIKVIYAGIDLERFKVRNIRLKDKKNKSKEVIIGTACRLCLEKGIDYLIRSIKKILDQGYKVRLLIAGAGPEESNLKKLTQDLGLEGKVQFLGFRKDIPSFLSQLDIFALASWRRESFGIAVAEAGALGIPAVVSNLSGLREVVIDQRTGFLVPLKDIDSLANALLKLIKDESLRKKMGQRALAHVRKNFTLEKMLSSFKKEFI